MAARNLKYPAVPVATATPDHVSVAVLEKTPEDGAPNDSPLAEATPPDISAYVAVMVVKVAVTTNVLGPVPVPDTALIVTTAPDAEAVYSGVDGLALMAAAKSVAVWASDVLYGTAPCGMILTELTVTVSTDPDAPVAKVTVPDANTSFVWEPLDLVNVHSNVPVTAASALAGCVPEYTSMAPPLKHLAMEVFFATALRHAVETRKVMILFLC